MTIHFGIRKKRAVITLTLLFFCYSASQAGKITVPSEEYRTINDAVSHAKAGDTVSVKKGKYFERLVLSPGVFMESETPLGAVIDAGGRKIAVKMAKNCGISGFEIRNGTIGIFTDKPGVSIQKCRILHNMQTGIMCVRSVPSVRDNIIIYNKASGIQGWDARSSTSSISHNIIAYNERNGISVGGHSFVVIESNIIVHNERYSIYSSSDNVTVNLKKNNLVGTASQHLEIPANNISKETSFIKPRLLDFRLSADCALKKWISSDSEIGPSIIY